MADGSTHPSPEELTAFSAGKLDEAAATAVARHVETCAACRAIIDQLPADSFLKKVRASAGDNALRVPIESLRAPGLTTGCGPLTEGPGTVIGPYKLLQQIGEGGMGVVYMAEQQEPVRRKVALKIIKPGMDSYRVIARFEAERQALAMMDHQNIARVLDAGTTPGEPGSVSSGRPYFVMELVHGVPITKFCDDNKLTPRERLALFVPVCQAIQHAHQKGIIHRDVKPSNVLVTMYDDKPVPKVIDFGVAKAIEQRLTEKTMFTQFGTLVGTFEYMSPEQAEMNAFGVDTRSDIYSLGVLLYELLTGTTPLERKRLREAALDEVVRLIREEEPPRPSARLSNSGNLPKIAAARKTEPGRLALLVRGELDWIVMRCLEKDRARRYETASALARDVEHYLHDEPVEACPPSARYRLSKFARKHKKALVTATAFAVLLVVGSVLSTVLAVWAQSAESEANRERNASDAAKRRALDAKVEADKQRDEARVIAYAAGMNLAQRAWRENDVGHARELLEEVPKEAAGTDLRGFEWYYLARLCHSEALTLTPHDGTVFSVAFSPDGQRLASAGEEAVKIWDCGTGKELLSLKGHAGKISSVTFSPDGQRLASGSSDKTVKIWDSTTGKEQLSLNCRAGEVVGVAFSPNGQRVASAALGGIEIWEVDSARPGAVSSLMALGEGDYAISRTAFSPNGRHLADAGETVRIWDCASGKDLFALGGQWGEGEVTSVAFSPDGQRLASGGQRQPIRIWDIATGKELLSFKGHTGDVWSVAFSPDGRRLASGSSDRTVTIWDSTSGDALFSLKGHADSVTSVAFSPQGERLASGSDDQSVKIWDCATDKELFSLRESARYQFPVVWTGGAFSPDSQRLAGTLDGAVKIWDCASGKALLAIEGQASPAFDSFGNPLASSLAFSPDGQRLASNGNGNTVKIWDSASGKELLSVWCFNDDVTSVAFSPDGKRLASADDEGLPEASVVRIWDTATGKAQLTLRGHADPVRNVAFSPDGQRLASAAAKRSERAGTFESEVKIWDCATGKELLSLVGSTCVAFSPDGQRLASADGADNKPGAVKIWDSTTGRELFSLRGHTKGVLSVAFSPDGRRLASGSQDSTVKIWDCVTGKELFSLKGHAREVLSVAFSPDGQRLASSGGDGSINLWESVSVSPEIQERRAENQLVPELFKQLALRADVLERLRALPGMSKVRREAALAAAQTYPERPGFALNELAWELVKLPGREMPGYRKALRYSEEACRLDPHPPSWHNALGVAYYRVGEYQKALDTLVRSDQINQKLLNGSIPEDLAFLAMTQHHLGHRREAQAYFQRLRERMKDPRWPKNADAQGFLREAEALLAQPRTPGGK